MQRIAAREAKNSFGRLIDMARAEPVAIEKHGRAVVVVIAFEEYGRLAGRDVAGRQDAKAASPRPKGEQ
jgi:prevent-host-death family protein